MGPSSPKRNGLFDTTNWMIRVKPIQHHDRVFTPVSDDDSKHWTSSSKCCDWQLLMHQNKQQD